MNTRQCLQFYKNNPFAACFVAANIIANSACAIMMSNFGSFLGALFGIGAVLCSIALAFSLPIIGQGASHSMGNKRRGAALIIISTWVLFSLIDVSMSYTTTLGRFEYARINADKQTALNQVYRDVALTASSTLDKCVGWKNCNSQDRMNTAERAAEKLEKSGVSWTPHEALGQTFVNLLIGGIAILSSLGSSIMGFISGLNTMTGTKTGKKPGNVATLGMTG